MFCYIVHKGIGVSLSWRYFKNKKSVSELSFLLILFSFWKAFFMCLGFFFVAFSIVCYNTSYICGCLILTFPVHSSRLKLSLLQMTINSVFYFFYYWYLVNSSHFTLPTCLQCPVIFILHLSSKQCFLHILFC